MKISLSIHLLIFALFQPLFCLAQNGEQAEAHHKIIKMMGSRFEITAVHSDAQTAWDGINAAIAEITRIEKLISSWDPNSQTSEINRQAGVQAVKVDAELYDLIARSLKVSKLTGGVFDISFASIDKVWKFDDSMTEMPSPETVSASVARIDYQNIILNPENSSIMLAKEGMKIGFGAIGKGYAANRAKVVMQQLGIQHGLVNASGDLTAWGKQADGQDWQIAIADPEPRK